jgi:hypothetical protein
MSYLHHLYFSNKYRQKYSNPDDSYDSVKGINYAIFKIPNKYTGITLCEPRAEK